MVFSTKLKYYQRKPVQLLLILQGKQKHSLGHLPAPLSPNLFQQRCRQYSEYLKKKKNQILLYVMDIARCQNPNSFMSNLLFCCSIFYKMKLPMVLIFNKIDVASAKEPLEWLQDYQSFLEACKKKDTYLTTLSKQMALTIEQFYDHFQVICCLYELQKKIVEVSSLTGEGFDKIEEAIARAREDYMNITFPDLKLQATQQKSKQQEIAIKELEKFRQAQKNDKMQTEG